MRLTRFPKINEDKEDYEIGALFMVESFENNALEIINIDSNSKSGGEICQ